MISNGNDVKIFSVGFFYACDRPYHTVGKDGVDMEVGFKNFIIVCIGKTKRSFSYLGFC